MKRRSFGRKQVITKTAEITWYSLYLSQGSRQNLCLWTQFYLPNLTHVSFCGYWGKFIVEDRLLLKGAKREREGVALKTSRNFLWSLLFLHASIIGDHCFLTPVNKCPCNPVPKAWISLISDAMQGQFSRWTSVLVCIMATREQSLSHNSTFSSQLTAPTYHWLVRDPQALSV